MIEETEQDTDVEDEIEQTESATESENNQNSDNEINTDKNNEAEENKNKTNDNLEVDSLNKDEVSNEEKFNQEIQTENISNQQRNIGQSSAQNNMQSSNSVLMSSQKEEKTNTYNGSDNNYLSSLSVSGYTLNKEFSKDNSTYFLTVENDVDSIDIVTDKESDSATVCIYGNEDLKDGTNKILISVTAENGNVRNYRIFVTRNS